MDIKRFREIKIILLLLILVILPQALVYAQDPVIDKLDFYYGADGISIKIKLKNTLPLDKPEISGERIRYIDKGSEVKLIFKTSISKKGWWVFNDELFISGKRDIIITRTLKKDIITKIYTIKETANVSAVEGLEEEYSFSGAILDDAIFKKEKFKRLRETFFEKELTFKIKYENLNLKNGSSYFVTSQAEYHSYKPIFGTGEPNNFFTKAVSTIFKEFYNV